MKTIYLIYGNFEGMNAPIMLKAFSTREKAEEYRVFREIEPIKGLRSVYIEEETLW